MAQGNACPSGRCPASGLPDTVPQAQGPASPANEQGTEKPFFYDRKHGWYWYEKEPLKPEKKKKEESHHGRVDVNLDDYTYQELWNMYPDDFQKILDIVLKQAVQDPTVKNVRDYLTMQDISRRKSVMFANVVGYVGQTNPGFSIDDTYPLTAPGRRSLTAMEFEETNTTIREARDRFALIMFSEEGCKFCESQKEILEYFEDYFSWPVRNIDIGRQPGMAARFNVERVPEIIIVSRETGDYMIISVGTTSMNELKDRVYRSIRLMQGGISPEQWYLHDFEKNTGMDPLNVVRKDHENITMGGSEQ
jgi:conjugal transfer pilus assembly protein TraF